MRKKFDAICSSRGGPDPWATPGITVWMEGYPRAWGTPTGGSIQSGVGRQRTDNDYGCQLFWSAGVYSLLVFGEVHFAGERRQRRLPQKRLRRNRENAKMSLFCLPHAKTFAFPSKIRHHSLWQNFNAAVFIAERAHWIW